MPNILSNNPPEVPRFRWIPEARRTLQLALPIMLGNLAGLAMNFVDTVMAGRLGVLALGAVALGGALWSAVFLFGLGVMLALPAVIAQLDGAGLRRQAGVVLRQALWLAVLIAALLWTVAHFARPVFAFLAVAPEVAARGAEYLAAMAHGAPAIAGLLALRFFSEGIGHTRPTMYFGFLGVALNVPLNYWFMYGGFGIPALGVVGIGWATAAVFWIQFLVWVLWIATQRVYRPYYPFVRFDKPHLRRLGRLLATGLPVGVMVAVEGSLFVAAALLIGRLGAVPIAAHQVAVNVAALTFMVPLGLAGAITVRVGNALGRGDPCAARFQGLLGIALALLIQTLPAGLMLGVPGLIVALYTADPTVAPLAVVLLGLAAVFQWSDGVQVVSAGALRGLKDTRIPMVYTIIAYWLVGLTSGVVLTFKLNWGASGMWVGMITGLTAAALLLAARFYRSAGRLIAEHERRAT